MNQTDTPVERPPPAPAQKQAPGAGRGTVFWRVAGVLVGAQVLLVLLAVLLSGRLAMNRSLDLVESSLMLRLDSAAEEVELRGQPGEGFAGMPVGLLIDLASRFEDPVYLFDPMGALRRVTPEGELVAASEADLLPREGIEEVRQALVSDTLVVEIGQRGGDNAYALAPVYDIAGLPSGGILVTPLTESVSAELSAPREAYVRAMWIVAIGAILAALLIGSYITWLMIRPLRAISNSIAAIGAGEYGRRLELASNDEFGRLARSVNLMAESVEQSVEVLREADRTRRRMVANMGHDLRTPLAAILGYMEEAVRYYAEGRHEQALRAIETASSQGKRLSQLVDDLFELSLLDSVPPPIRREPVPMGELLTEVAGLHRRLLTEKGVSFTEDIQHGLPVINGDGNRLMRLLNNLLTNARAHTPAGGSVRLAGSRQEQEVVVVVSDTGEGIPPEEIDAIFERHVRGQSARTRKETGTGLGLAISRAIARAHGGSLEVDSGPDLGARFVLRLPL